MTRLQEERARDTSPPSSTERIASLDAVRGIAAFVVVLSHLMATLTENDRGILFPFLASHLEDPWFGLPFSLSNTPLGLLLVSARPAVMIFFVLSGYVLALGLMRQDRMSYRAFMVRRVCRIWLPFAASIVLSATLWLALKSGDLPEFKATVAEIWADRPTVGILADHLLMRGIQDSAKSLDPPMWSLVYELRIALVFPLLMLLARCPLWMAVPAGLIVQVLVDLGLRAQGAATRPLFASDATQSVLMTAHFVPPFLIGILLARHRGRMAQVLLSLLPLARPALWALAFLLLLRWHDVPSSLGAGLIIALAPNSESVDRALQGRFVQWLGTISYSLYLVHMPVIMALLHGLHSAVPARLIVLLAIPVCLLAAAVMQHLVEQPSMILARRLGTMSKGGRPSPRPIIQRA